MIIRKYGLLMYSYVVLVLGTSTGNTFPVCTPLHLYYCTMYGTSTKYRYYR